MASNALHSYLQETQRPVYSAVLVLPFLLTYQIGVVVLRTGVINGGDALIRRMLSFFPFQTALVSVAVLLICFVVWQWRAKASWRMEPGKLALLAAESLLFAEVLFHLLRILFQEHPGLEASASPAAAAGPRHHLVELVLYCGAGVYEELVFRVLLLGLLLLVCTKLLHMDKVPAAVWSVVVGALLFSLFHYIGPGGDVLTLNGFLQRAFAGLYFATLYVTRSFGVAAAAHALYDVRVGLYDLWA